MANINSLASWTQVRRFCKEVGVDVFLSHACALPPQLFSVAHSFINRVLEFTNELQARRENHIEGKVCGKCIMDAMTCVESKRKREKEKQ